MKKLFNSVISLILATILCIVTAYAWFSHSEIATANSVVAATENANCVPTLYTYSIAQKKYIKITDSIDSLIGLTPNDIVFFKLEITSLNSRDMPIVVSYADFESKLNDNELIVEDEYIVTKDLLNNTLKLYEIIDNKVLIEDEILYKYSQNNLSLDYYKIENVMLSYNLENSYPVDGNTYNIAAQREFLNGLSGMPLSNNIYDDNLAKDSTIEIYFALEFNEDLADISGNSNCYQFQELIINHIKIQMA